MEIVSEKLLFRLKILGGLGFPRINPTIYHFFINIIIHQPQQWIRTNSCLLVQLEDRRADPSIEAVFKREIHESLFKRFFTLKRRSVYAGINSSLSGNYFFIIACIILCIDLNEMSDFQV